MSGFPERPTLADFESLPGLREAIAFATGLSADGLVGEGLRAGMVALLDAGLAVPFDFRPVDTESGPFLVDLSFALRAARHVVAGSDGRFLSGLRKDPSPSTDGECAGWDAVLSRFGARWWPLGDGKVRAVHAGTPFLAAGRPALGLTVRGELSMVTRLVPLPGDPDAFDMGALDPDDLVGAWEEGRAATTPTDGRYVERWFGPSVLALHATTVHSVAIREHVALRGFVGHLPDEATEVLGHLPWIWETADASSASHAYAAVAAYPRPRRFAQAFEAAPALACILHPYVRLAANAHGCSRAARRIAEGDSPRAVFAEVLGRPMPPVVLAALMARSRMPDPDAPFVLALRSAFAGVSRHRPLDPDEPDAIYDGLRQVAFSTPVHDWDAFAPRVLASLRDRHGTYRRPGQAADAIRWFVAVARRCGIRGSGTVEAMVSVFFPHGRRLESLLRLVDRWHDRFMSLDAMEASARFETFAAHATDVDRSALFPPFPAFAVPEGTVVERLASHERCVREGLEMSHCVAAYGDLAAAGEVVLFSIRDRFGRSTASLDVAFDEDGAVVLSVGQVRGPGNAAAPPSHAALARGLAESSRTPPVLGFLARVLDPSGLRDPTVAFGVAVREAMRCADAVRNAESALPQAARDRLADAAFDSLRPFLSKSARAGGRLAWVASMERCPVRVPEVA